MCRFHERYPNFEPFFMHGVVRGVVSPFFYRLTNEVCFALLAVDFVHHFRFVCNIQRHLASLTVYVEWILVYWRLSGCRK